MPGGNSGYFDVFEFQAGPCAVMPHPLGHTTQSYVKMMKLALAKHTVYFYMGRIGIQDFIPRRHMDDIWLNAHSPGYCRGQFVDTIGLVGANVGKSDCELQGRQSHLP